jgi:hypothetical protein
VPIKPLISAGGALALAIAVVVVAAEEVLRVKVVVAPAAAVAVPVPGVEVEGTAPKETPGALVAGLLALAVAVVAPPLLMKLKEPTDPLALAGVLVVVPVVPAAEAGLDMNVKVPPEAGAGAEDAAAGFKPPPSAKPVVAEAELPAEAPAKLKAAPVVLEVVVVLAVAAGMKENPLD